MRISCWSSDVCSSALGVVAAAHDIARHVIGDDPVAALARALGRGMVHNVVSFGGKAHHQPRPLLGRSKTRQNIGIFHQPERRRRAVSALLDLGGRRFGAPVRDRSEEHTSELQSLMRISYAVFCLKKKNNKYKK